MVLSLYRSKQKGVFEVLFDYGNFFDLFHDPESVFRSFASIFNGFTSVLGSLAGLAAYVLFGLAVMTMGQKLGVKYPWLSWIPFAKSYAFGKIAETPDKPRKTGSTLLTLRILICAFGLLSILSAIVFAVFLVAYADSYGSPVSLIISAIFLVLFLLGMAGVSIAYTVVYYMAFYRITKLFAKDKYLTYFLLGFLPIFVGLSIATPIVLMVLSAKEPDTARMFPFGFDQFGNVHSNTNDN